MSSSNNNNNNKDVIAASDRSKLYLRLTSRMFRQHSDLFLQQAAVLERIATCPTDPDSWRIEEESPESVEQKLLKENVSVLAKKSFEGMLQVQKRVDWLERAVIRKGIKPRRQQSSAATKNPPKAKRIPNSIGTAYYHFSNEHGPRIAASMGLKSYTVNAVKSELLRIWSTMNPQDRLPYLEKAEKARNSAGGKRKADESTAVDEALSDQHESSDDDEKDDKQDNEQGSSEGDRNSDDDSEDEPALLFLRKPVKRSRVSEKEVE